MALRLDDKWIWDFWLAQDGPDFHIFYLQAPRALKNPELRHWHVSIGHAVSTDLRNWSLLPDALHPSPPDSSAWDNYTTWTGSITPYGKGWAMLYTGSSRAEKGLVQRIGLATSPDLLTWTKHPRNPVLTADPRFYEQLDRNLWHDQAWRDPWVFRHEGRFHAYVTARGLEGEPSGRGVIGHALSDDLVHWQCLPPAAHPGEFGHMEVPQLVHIGHRWYLFFCVGHGQYARARLARQNVARVTGTHYLVGETAFGPFRMLEEEFLLADEAGSNYAGKAVRDPQGGWALLASRSRTASGGYRGEIGDPMPLAALADGRLRAAAS